MSSNPEKSSAVISAQPARILRWPEVHTLVGRSRSSVWRDIRKGKFPKAVDLGENSVGWFEHEIQEWIASRPRAAYAAWQGR